MQSKINLNFDLYIYFFNLIRKIFIQRLIIILNLQEKIFFKISNISNCFFTLNFIKTKRQFFIYNFLIFQIYFQLNIFTYIYNKIKKLFSCYNKIYKKINKKFGGIRFCFMKFFLIFQKEKIFFLKNLNAIYFNEKQSEKHDFDEKIKSLNSLGKRAIIQSEKKFFYWYENKFISNIKSNLNYKYVKTKLLIKNKNKIYITKKKNFKKLKNNNHLHQTLVGFSNLKYRIDKKFSIKNLFIGKFNQKTKI